jgi:hypothetical protein
MALRVRHRPNTWNKHIPQIKTHGFHSLSDSKNHAAIIDRSIFRILPRPQEDRSRARQTLPKNNTLVPWGRDRFSAAKGSARITPLCEYGDPRRWSRNHAFEVSSKPGPSICRRTPRHRRGDVALSSRHRGHDRRTAAARALARTDGESSSAVQPSSDDLQLSRRPPSIAGHFVPHREHPASAQPPPHPAWRCRGDRLTRCAAAVIAMRRGYDDARRRPRRRGTSYNVAS